MKAVIVGAGIGGLAAAIRLRALKLDVEVYESNPYPGGKLTAFTKDGFRFDAGPSLFTMPHLVDELFTLAGKKPRDYFVYQKLESITNYFFEDGTTITAFADRQRFLDELKSKLAIDPTCVDQYLSRSQEIYNTVSNIFLENSLHRWKTWWTKKVAKALTRIYRFGIFDSIDSFNKKLLNHPKLIQLFNRYATYNGSNPYKAPGILSSIPHLEFNLGSYFPQGGMHSITQSLYQLALDMGVSFNFNSSVDEIMLQDNRAIGVRLGNHIIKADFVVSNMDVYFTYKKLLPSAKAPLKTLSQERSSSALIFYWGIAQSFQQLDLHNIFFSSDYQKEFKVLFEQKSIADDPTVYLNITSKLNPTDAPAHMENWFIMVNAPSNSGQDWDRLILACRKKVIEKLSRILKADVGSLIVSEHILDPRSIELKTSSYQGSLYGTSSNSKFAAFMRHPNHKKQFQNLFFCGGSVHPGGGIPLCLQSAKIISLWIEEQLTGKIVSLISKDV
jgi:phytoene desaturase